MGVKLGSNKTKINTGGKQDHIKWQDLVDLFEFPNHEFKTARPVGEIFAIGTHWFEVEGKKKDGSPFKFRTGRTCRNIKSDGTVDPNGGCAFCKVNHQPRTSYLQCQIDPELEDSAPRNNKISPEEKKSGFKTKGSKLWTPVRVLIFPPSVAETMQKLTLKNKDKEGGIRELSDPVFGKALDISRDTRKGTAPANMWNVQKADEPMRKLTPDQRAYYLYDIASAIKTLMPSVKQSMDDMKFNVPQMIDKDYETLDLSEFPELEAKRKGGGKKKAKSGKFDVDDEDDEDEDDLPKRKNRRVDDDDDEDDDLPRRSNKRAARDDDDDEDEDDAPVRRNKKKRAKKSKSFNIKNIL